MKPLRFGCIGCGNIATLHLLNSSYVPGMQVVAFADVREEAANRFLKDFGGEYATGDVQRLLADKSLDAVLIQTGEKHHPALGIAAARAGKHIFMEKPVAVSIEEALELRKAIREAGVRYMIGLCNRLAPMVRKAKELLPHPWITVGQCADNISGQACHNLDLILHLFHESPLRSVYASGGSYYGSRSDQRLPADSFAATLKFEDGSQASYVQHGKAYNCLMSKYSFQLFGKDRCVFLARRFKECHLSTNLNAPDLSYVFQGPDFSPQKPEAADQHFKDSRGPHGYMGHFDEMVALCRAIREGTEPPMTVDHGINALAAEKAILESVVTGQVIDYRQFLARWKLDGVVGDAARRSR